MARGITAQAIILISFEITAMCYKTTAHEVSCQENEFWDSRTEQCVQCTLCNNICDGLVVWLPCAFDRDTVCGPRWIVPTRSTVQEDPINGDKEEIESVRSDKWIWDILSITLALSVTVLAVSLVFLAILHLRRKWREQTRRNGIKSVYDFDSMRCTDRPKNLYVDTEELQNLTKCDV